MGLTLQQIADMMSGLANDTTSEDLEEMRDMRKKARARAGMASEMAGLDTKREEEDLLAELEAGAANDEFAALMEFQDEQAPQETGTKQADSWA